MDAWIIAALLVALVAGALIGWLLGQRPLSALKAELAVAAEQARRAVQTEESLRDLTEQRNALDREVSALRPLSGQFASQARELSAVRSEKEALAAAKAAFERGEEERGRSFAQQLAQVKELEAKLETRFGELAGKAVETAHESFLKRASEKLDGERKEHQANLQNLLQPVEATLKRYEEGLQRVEAERKDSYGELRGVLGELRKDNGQVRDETRNLVNALRSSPKARGRWGEQSLDRKSVV